MKDLKSTYLEIFNSIDFEKIKDHPNILIAANFWEADRFQAAKTCYKFMRAIDDLIDDHKAAKQTITADEKEVFLADVDRWLKMIYNGNSQNPLQTELTDTINKYHIPAWPLEAFARSMIFDINNDGFSTLEEFIGYSGGASVAPAAIFVHLAGLRKDVNGYLPPVFDVKEAARACAIFSYLVHIIRDFVKDQLNNLNYFADDMLVRNGLTRNDLTLIARGSEVTDGFRKMIAEYLQLAEEYRVKTKHCIENIWPFLEPRYQLSLEIIFELYQMVFERIDPVNGTFSTRELNPTPAESAERVLKTILSSKTLQNSESR
ncbi:MAG: squalene/phytoene synthase family protein [Bacteroidales bacterium]